MEGNENEKSGEKEGDSNYYGFDLYPERRSAREEPTFYQTFFYGSGHDATCQLVCEKNVITAIKKNPIVKLLMGALKNAGCPIDISRHIVCETCNPMVTGGYDQEMNQIVICSNKFQARNLPEATLVHEMIHMFDYCVGNVDFRNLEHLACTEIRAANLSHCSFLSSFFLGQSSPINIKQTHQYCVKMKAAQSLMLGRKIDFETAMDVILKVFDKCYNDLEPIGRRIMRNSQDPTLAYNECISMGFCK